MAKISLTMKKLKPGMLVSLKDGEFCEVDMKEHHQGAFGLVLGTADGDIDEVIQPGKDVRIMHANSNGRIIFVGWPDPQTVNLDDYDYREAVSKILSQDEGDQWFYKVLAQRFLERGENDGIKTGKKKA